MLTTLKAAERNNRRALGLRYGPRRCEDREGVYVLRRALMLAGPESQVLGLWQVADKATRELMVGYYTGL